ncbi:hypothetical protein [Saccharopolyspora dendranthemae]|uniref:Acetyltransferase (GNAT) family protein n=1 Tax=Saccharopolyspora dendranthemae TaxID=1181886 RepID=A0A561U5S1_9PSEU|nr:hypothetical protein [Saccharopolyspora dendranthemae]TWF94707.1 hypothetical protein FHU35_13423 [Saccharopolyspora dendranthemae]
MTEEVPVRPDSAPCLGMCRIARSSPDEAVAWPGTRWELGTFYERLGWKEIGRWPGALRLSPDDTRDEILMFLEL